MSLKDKDFHKKFKKFLDLVHINLQVFLSNNKAKNYRLPDYQVSKNKSNTEDMERQYQWLFGSDRTSYIQNKNNPIGPGSYNLNQNLTKNNASWNKSNRFHN